MYDSRTAFILKQARAAVEPDETDQKRVRQSIATAFATGVAVTAATAAVPKSTAMAATIVSALKHSLWFKSLLGLCVISAGLAIVTSLKEELHHQPQHLPATTNAHHADPSPNVQKNKTPLATVTAPPVKDPIAPKPLNSKRQPPKKKTTTNPPKPNELLAEMALIKKANRALHQNNPKAALVQLRAHATRHPRGAMRLEREGLEVLALCALGNSERARQAKAKFLASGAKSPLSILVREACVE